MSEIVLRRRLALYLVVGLFSILHIPYVLDDTLTGSHVWRQADVAAVAKNFVVESANLFLPRVDGRGTASGITGMEFPLFSYVVSLLYRISDSFWLGYGKALSLLCAFASMSLLWKIVCLEDIRPHGDKPWLFFLAAFLSPFFYIFSAKFLPEFTALLFALSGFFLFHKAVRTSQSNFFLGSWVLLSLALLIRPYYGFFGLPVLVQFFHARSLRARLSMLVFGVCVLTPFVIWYGMYAPYLNRTFGIDYFYMGSPLYDNLKFVFSWTGMAAIFQVVVGDYLGYLLAPLFIFGVSVYLRSLRQFGMLSWKAPTFQLLVIAALTILVLPFVIGNHFRIHTYYLGAIMPGLFIGCYFGLITIAEKRERIFVPLIFLLGIALLGGVWHTYRINKEVIALNAQKQEFLKIVTRNDLLVIDAGGDPYWLYVLDRKGWSVKLPNEPNERAKALDGYKAQGAGFLLEKAKDSNGGTKFLLVRL